MHDTTISSIKKLVLVCLVTIMKWLVTLDAGLPVVVSLMTSTPSSLSQTWSSYRFCRLEQHDNMANRRKNSLEYLGNSHQNFKTLDVECWWSITHPAHIGALVVEGNDRIIVCNRPKLHSIPHHPLPSAENDDDHHINEENVNDHDMHWLENISSSIHWW